MYSCQCGDCPSCGGGLGQFEPQSWTDIFKQTVQTGVQAAEDIFLRPRITAQYPGGTPPFNPLPYPNQTYSELPEQTQTTNWLPWLAVAGVGVFLLSGRR